MSEEATTPPDGGDDAPLGGRRLAEARRAREISIQDVANALHVDEHKVRALEQNEFEKLGAPVFAKGYLRKYAALVGISVEDILADYYRLNRSAAMPLVIPTRPRQPRDVSPGPWLAGLTAVFVIAAAGWWWLSAGSEWLDRTLQPTSTPPFADDHDRRTAPAADEGTPPAENAVDDAGGEAESAGESRSTAELPAVAGEVQGAGQPGIELRLTFIGDCWTEVTDASGERLFFGLGSAGRVVTISGQPPLQVLLGDSANASLAVDGSSYPIPQSARRGNTARFTITDL